MQFTIQPEVKFKFCSHFLTYIMSLNVMEGKWDDAKFHRIRLWSVQKKKTYSQSCLWVFVQAPKRSGCPVLPTDNNSLFVAKISPLASKLKKWVHLVLLSNFTCTECLFSFARAHAMCMAHILHKTCLQCQLACTSFCKRTFCRLYANWELSQV